MSFIASILTRALRSLYEILPVSLLLAFLFMFAYLFGKEIGVRRALKAWRDAFVKNKRFRRVFFFALYTAMILCKTLLIRSIWDEPFKDVLGVWGIYDREGQLYTENIENVILFLPFTFLFFLTFGDRIKSASHGRTLQLLRVGILLSLGLSVTIEGLQLMLRMGAIQLSDVVFNTAGGFLGCMLYLLLRRKQPAAPEKEQP